MNFWIALGAGYFADEGLEVYPISPPQPDRSGRFLMMGRGDVAVLPGPQMIDLVAAEEPVAIFANLLSNDPINLVVRKDVAERLNISPTASVKDKLESLKGLKIAVAAGPVTTLRLLFESVGLNADEHVEVVVRGGGVQNRTLGDGDVDAIYAHSPYLETALVNQGAVQLIDQAAGEVPELAGRQIHVMLATRAYVDQNSEKVEKLVRAIYRAQQLVRTDLDQAVAALADSGVQGVDPELIGRIVEIYAPALPLTPAVSGEGILRQLRAYPAHREKPDLAGIDVSLYVAPQFAEKVLAE
jgi:NitT/TauT family transport system substrate-binding protein